MWTYRAALLDILDADTIRVTLDLGCHVRTQQDIRLLAVSAPELSQPGGIEAQRWVADWMTGLADLTWPLLITTSPNTRPEPEERRSFVRYLGTVTDIADGRVLNTDLAHWLTGHPEWGSGT
jgi:endonuclease YncB( thermonuclease family)